MIDLNAIRRRYADIAPRDELVETMLADLRAVLDEAERLQASTSTIPPPATDDDGEARHA